MTSRSRRSFCGPATPCDSGQAGEHLVAADLLRKGLRVTKPLNTNGDHDLHAQFSVGWRTVQVKLGEVHWRTRTISPKLRGGQVLSSDIIAWIDLARLRIRYLAREGEALPKELLRNTKKNKKLFTLISIPQPAAANQ